MKLIGFSKRTLCYEGIDLLHHLHDFFCRCWCWADKNKRSLLWDEQVEPRWNLNLFSDQRSYIRYHQHILRRKKWQKNVQSVIALKKSQTGCRVEHTAMWDWKSSSKARLFPALFPALAELVSPMGREPMVSSKNFPSWLLPLISPLLTFSTYS